MPQSGRSKKSSGKSDGNIGCIVWLILLCVVFLLFIANWGKIQATIKSTNFNEIIKTERQKNDDAQNDPKETEPSAPAPKPATDTEAPLVAPSPADKFAPVETEAPVQPASKPVAAGSENTTSEKPMAPPSAVKPGTKTPMAKPASAAPARSRVAVLYFVRIDDDGIISRQEVKRQIPATDSPLSDSLAALMKGPTSEELGRKLISLIPQGTILLSAQVRGSTAFLNFNEAFMYNNYGIEGYAGQLKQVVYTTTAFPTVQDVQILIEGERHDYLGGEGVYIGRPLSRNSF